MAHQDTYHLWVPIRDDEDNLLKSVEVDENGDYLVQGVMTSDERDEENDSIDPEGMDCSYFLSKGWIKYEHGNRPEQFIGEPLEVRVGQFTHPTLQKTVNGIFVKGRLFAQRALAREAVKTIQDLQKSNTKRCMGWSIEGQVKERDRKTGKIIKSVLRNVVLTMNPVNTTTWAELAKSFAKNHEVTIDCEEPLDKSMDTGSIAEITPQSLEGAPKKEEDPQKKFLKLLRKMVKDHFIHKSLRRRFLQGTPAQIEANAFDYAIHHQFSFDDAVAFSEYVANNEALFKSLFSRRSFGGEIMSKLASFLDEELEELRKSLDELDNEEETLEKSVGSDEDSEDEDEYEGSEEDADAEDEGDDEEEEDTEKSFKTNLTKSLAKEHQQAFEVSDFLVSLTDEIGFGMEGLEKSMSHLMKQNQALVKSMTSMLQVVQELTQKVEAFEAHNEELQKSLEDLLNRPVGRKSVVTQRERNTLSKSMETEPLTPAKVQDILMKSFEAGELSGSEIIRYEAGVPLEQLKLPDSVKQRLGL